MSETVSVHGPEELLAVLPYQLGYHPRRSVVAVALDGRRVHFVARVDIPPERHVPDTVAALAGPLRREVRGPVHLVGYEDVEGESTALLLALLEDVESDGVEVVEVLVVRDGRRYSPTCSGPCCPEGGVPLPSPEAVPAVAALVALGRAPLADRAAVDRAVHPDPARSAVVGALLAADGPGASRRRGRDGLRAWAQVLGRDAVDRGAPVPAPAVAAAVAALRDVHVRDALIGWLAPGVIPREVLDPIVLARLERWLPRWGGLGAWEPGGAGAGDPDAVLARLLALCRDVPDSCPDDAAAVCTAAAQVAWAHGDGALARAALDRALRVEPGYRLARLLAALVERGVRPVRAADGAGDLDRRAG
ncbi:DUF4192 family protein [Phycicoccus sonneratiae]|uniref:DUF4192 family protein n=1 Tax=Phycicoccus sonneratiae TaxID=2807628 RepID=A0ABS2CK27_9MICO|nr:DUF4192 family protein [Phycicoccus sonneraticus]MBM6400231.1 DUF4192 family protein [Phycicoccus sonneraticus]